MLARAAAELKRTPLPRGSSATTSVSAEKGYLREAGNLLFHLSVLVVLVGFAIGGLFGYKGGVIVLKGRVRLLQRPHAVRRLRARQPVRPERDLEPFSFTIKDFEVDWLTEGPRAGHGAQVRRPPRLPGRRPAPRPRTYDLRVNHPLTIGGTEVFLIGHGYAPVITIRDGNGDVAYSGPTVFLPIDPRPSSPSASSRRPTPSPTQIGLEGDVLPDLRAARRRRPCLPSSIFGEPVNPLLSLSVYTGDLGLDDGTGASVYVLDKSKADAAA